MDDAKSVLCGHVPTIAHQLLLAAGIGLPVLAFCLIVGAGMYQNLVNLRSGTGYHISGVIALMIGIVCLCLLPAIR